VRIPRSSHSPSDRGPETPKSQGLPSFRPRRSSTAIS